MHLLRVAHPGQPQVLLQACGDHAGPARACGPVLGEHPFTGWCGFPGAFWDQPANACQLDDGGTSVTCRQPPAHQRTRPSGRRRVELDRGLPV